MMASLIRKPGTGGGTADDMTGCAPNGRCRDGVECTSASTVGNQNFPRPFADGFPPGGRYTSTTVGNDVARQRKFAETREIR